MDTREILIKARELISTPDKWCKNALERRGAHCALGALIVIDESIWKSGADSPAVQELAAAVKRNGYYYDGGRGEWTLVANYNNSHSHAEVLAMFDAAIGPRTDISSLTALLDANSEPCSPVVNETRTPEVVVP